MVAGFVHNFDILSLVWGKEIDTVLQTNASLSQLISAVSFPNVIHMPDACLSAYTLQ